MSSLLSFPVVVSALELGFIYALVALALFLSYSILNIADLSTDGCFTLGCAVGAQVAIMGHPVLALFAAMAAGVCSGFIMASLQTKLGVEPILAGIIVNTGLYTVNLAVMGFSSNLSIFKNETIYSLFKDWLGSDWYRLVVSIIIVVIVCALLAWFLGTRMGLSIRATGDNEDMVKASSINPGFTVTVGLCISGSMTALSGCLIGHYQKTCDINLGTGMVTIALASLIIGETLVGKHSVFRRIVGVILGSCLYRFAIAIALRLHVPAECLKLVSAVIVAIAIASPYLKQQIAFQKRKLSSASSAKGGDGTC